MGKRNPIYYNVCAVYKIESKVSGRFYIGSSIDINNRWRIHEMELEENRHHSIYLQRHYNKHGKDDLMFSIIEIVTYPELVLEREQYYLDKLKPQFNMCKQAKSTLGFKYTEEQKEKISKAMKGRRLSDEHKLKISLSRRRSDVGGEIKPNKYLQELEEEKLREVKAKTSKPKKPWSEETKRKFREKRMNHPVSEETRRKISVARMNKGRIQEHLEYIKNNIKNKSQGTIAKELGVSQSGISKLLKQCA